MIVTVFRSRLNPNHLDDYQTRAQRMSELARQMPGYISHKGFVAEDGERVTIVEFESEETQRAWATHPEHVQAMRDGRTQFYTEYRLQICQLLRDSAVRPARRQTQPAQTAP